MNKTAIRNFAVRARKKLIENIIQKAYELGIAENGIKGIEAFEGGFRIKGLENSKVYKKYEEKQREKLIAKIKEKGFQQVMEEVAYTWFNRFIALRFMEINGYLDVRVLSSSEGRGEPDILKEALNTELDLDQELVYKLMDANDAEDLYKYLLIKQCNQLGEIMPMVFEKIADDTELLLPDYLLTKGSVVRDLVESIDEEDYKDQVEIIGWLYQYYISEKKDEVFADLKKNKKITKENIPAATQLFTPKWIVKYMVENSLGKLWLESHPDEALESQWKFYLKEASQDPEVQKKLDVLKNPNLNPEEIKVLDPAMGSGHILVYAFDVLYDIYLKANYSERDIPQLILEKNLYGLDIDDRAGQLAAFALLMKARSKNRRIFRKKIDLNICSIQESNDIPKEVIEYFDRSDLHLQQTEDKQQYKKDAEYLLKTFQDAKDYGSILDVKTIDFHAIENILEEMKKGEIIDLFYMQYRGIILEKFPRLIKQAKIMSEKYDVVVANPPYSGLRRLNDKLKKYIEDHFQAYKYDLFSVFIVKNIDYTKASGFMGLMTPNVWQYISSYKNLRELIINNYQLTSLIQLPDDGFKDASVAISTFVIRKDDNKYNTSFLKLDKDFDAFQKEEKTERIKKSFSKNLHVLNTDLFKSIPDNKIAFWASEKTIKTFLKGRKLEEIAKPRQGMATSDNNRFLRLWYEVSVCKIQFPSMLLEDFPLKWVPYNKGGGYRKWYGNNEFVINWANHGEEVKEYAKKLYGSYSRTIKNEKFYFKQGITYTFIGKDLGPRFTPNGFIFDVAGSMIFIEGEKLFYILGLMASKLSKHYIDILNPTINIQVGDIKNIPVILEKEKIQSIKVLVSKCIEIAQKDWDFYETSWDFNHHPLLSYAAIKSNQQANKIENAFEEWIEDTNRRFDELKSYEEELNRIFIEAYDLKDEFSPEVKAQDITIRRADREEDMKSFISYAVGCMFGRYSLDEEGLIYAGGEFNDKFKVEEREVKIHTSQGWRRSSIDVTKDNIILVADEDYFEDDLLNRFVAFIKVSFGEEALEENLNYLAETLGKKPNETSRQVIRRYFLKDFYNDHIKTYNKRPIYWLFDSGKENGFKALIYMHRYDISTVARVRTDYLHKLQKKYEAEVKRLDLLLASELSIKEKAATLKRKDNINKQIMQCCMYDQVMAHVANQKIQIDLDEGVQANYSKFQGIKIPQEEGKKSPTADLLARI
ncbi:type I restriction-modification system methyltransferase subunit [Clostridium aceticum]|uniref:site-specific DNA-methyltransferase (adenine-specific) n=1 Tax=Clostridium aceticum TaxID=84022 RepID=A0A0D8I905_9CLOT|nr:BREX-1 system adenine-specific DNA-methyltransferase PglX [Clostridium aceticum]AKL95667.1 type I restriction-modification system methyltransferase subunit [Clostridium aceticum]KJF26770.1 restriction endonuclease [Clostridium aceticum]